MGQQPSSSSSIAQAAAAADPKFDPPRDLDRGQRKIVAAALDPQRAGRILPAFAVGKPGVLLFGNPLVMARYSGWVADHLSDLIEQSAQHPETPIAVLPTVPATSNGLHQVLVHVWLYINDYTDDPSTSASDLTLADLLLMLNWLHQLQVDLAPDALQSLLELMTARATTAAVNETLTSTDAEGLVAVRNQLAEDARNCQHDAICAVLSRTVSEIEDILDVDANDDDEEEED